MHSASPQFAHTPPATLGLFLPLHAKPETSAALADFLLTGYSLVSDDREPETLQWFGVKYTPAPNAPNAPTAPAPSSPSTSRAIDGTGPWWNAPSPG